MMNAISSVFVPYSSTILLKREIIFVVISLEVLESFCCASKPTTLQLSINSLEFNMRYFNLSSSGLLCFSLSSVIDPSSVDKIILCILAIRRDFSSNLDFLTISEAIFIFLFTSSFFRIIVFSFMKKSFVTRILHAS